MNQLSTSRRIPNKISLTHPFFFIVGQSGSGKDTLLEYVKDHWPIENPPLHIIQRYITRPAHKSEPFHSINKEKFKEMEEGHFFAFTWFVYDTFYGVPSTIFNDIERGDIVIINVSRVIIHQIKDMYPTLKVILIKVTEEIAQDRIQTRGREKKFSQEYQERLQRGEIFSDTSYADLIIYNSGALHEGGEKLIFYLTSIIRKGRK